MLAKVADLGVTRPPPTPQSPNHGDVDSRRAQNSDTGIRYFTQLAALLTISLTRGTSR